jgi:hypothetical protein
MPMMGASDSVYTMAAGIPSYGIRGVAIDRNDVRRHGKDERGCRIVLHGGRVLLRVLEEAGEELIVADRRLRIKKTCGDFDARKT